MFFDKDILKDPDNSGEEFTGLQVGSVLYFILDVLDDRGFM